MSAARPTLFHRIPGRAIRVPLPDVSQQTAHSCGPSALQSVCRYYGIGPGEESAYGRALHYDHRVGCHARSLVAAARGYGLRCREYPAMTDGQLRTAIRRRRPVLIPIQAWARNGRDAADTKDWSDGHWVAVIGYDRTGFFVEDPKLQAVRGYIPATELGQRWRDRGRRGKHLKRYGLVLWKPGARRSAYACRAAFLR